MPDPAADFASLVFSPALLFLVGLAAGMLNVMAGGGSSLTLPVLIFLGLDGTEANGTNRLSILLQNVSACASFSREHTGNVAVSLKYSLLMLPGAIAGAFTATAVDNILFKKIVAVVIIAVAVSMFLPLPKFSAERVTARHKWVLYPGLVVISFYGGFIQVGIGLAIMALLFHTIGGNIASVNFHKIFIVMIYTIPVLGVFFISGDVDVLKGLNLAAGTMVGGWWAAKISVKKGVAAARYFIAFAIAIAALKLFEVF